MSQNEVFWMLFINMGGTKVAQNEVFSFVEKGATLYSHQKFIIQKINEVETYIPESGGHTPKSAFFTIFQWSQQNLLSPLPNLDERLLKSY